MDGNDVLPSHDCVDDMLSSLPIPCDTDEERADDEVETEPDRAIFVA